MARQPRTRGQHIESLISRWLIEQGLTLVERNFARRMGEIDLIMRKPESGLIVFVEVRYRNSEHFGGGLASVDARKQAKLLKTASAWLQRHADPRLHARFDVIAVGPDSGPVPETPLPGETPVVSWSGLRILWIQDAFQGS